MRRDAHLLLACLVVVARAGPSALGALKPTSSANGTAACAALAADLDAGGLWPRLREALAAAPAPAVQVFANDAHRVLLGNFLCGLAARPRTRGPASRCRDDLREISGGKLMNNRDRRTW